jgi:hypothetical protein
MALAMDFRRHALGCARLAEDCDDRRLADLFRKRAADLLSKADDIEELPGEQARKQIKNASGSHSCALAEGYSCTNVSR